MIDTHCHLESIDYDNIDEIIDKCTKNNINRLIVSGHDVNSCKEVIDLINKYDIVYGTVGYLPDTIDSISKNDIDYLEQIIKNNKKIIGIGEIGLDYHYDNDNKDKQKKLFTIQLMLAKKYNLPVVIHSRDSINDTYNILKENNIKRGTMHCYSGSLEYAYKFIDLGLYISVGGVVTFKNAKEIKRVVKHINLENILLETDSPYLTPTPYRGKKNYPYYLPLIAQEIANIKHININKVIDTTISNTNKLFDNKLNL